MGSEVRQRKGVESQESTKVDDKFKNPLNIYPGKNVWAIHGKCYDLTKFIDTHPGGREFIELSKNSDCTVAFVTHHRNDEKILKDILGKYEIKGLEAPPDPWTTEKGGFYYTLRERVLAIADSKGIMESAPYTTYDLAYRTMTIVLTIIAYMSLYMVWFSDYKFTFSIIHAFSRIWAAGTGHPYLHNASVFWELFFDLSFFQGFQWKKTHVFSHHIYTNNNPLDSDINDVLDAKTWIPRFLRPIAFILPAGKGTFDFPIFYYKHGAPLHHWAIRFVMLAEFLAWCYMAPLYWLMIYVLMGYYFIFVFFVGHYLDSYYGVANWDDNKKKLAKDWGALQVMTTADFTVSGIPLLDAVLGLSLSSQVSHHLFPQLKNAFLWSIVDPIVYQTIEEFKIPYNKPQSIWKLLPKVWNSLVYEDDVSPFGYGLQG